MTTTAAPSSSTRPAIAAILAISAAATLFLFWLIYIHPAAATSAQYAFLPALNAVLNGLSRHCAADRLHVYPRAQHQGASRGHDHRLRLLHALPGQLHPPPRAAWRCALPRPRGLARRLPAAAGQPHHSRRRRAAAGAGHLLLLAHRPHSPASQSRPLDISPLALRLRHRRHHLRDAAPGARI